MKFNKCNPLLAEGEDRDIISLKTTSLMVLDLRNEYCVSRLEKVIGKYMIPDPAGIYNHTSSEPILSYDKKYYTKEGLINNPSTPIQSKEFVSLEEDIYNEEGVIIIPAALMKLKSKLLRNRPSINTCLVEIIRYLISQYLESPGNFNKSADDDDVEAIKQVIQFQYYDSITIDFIDECCVILDPIFILINNFVGEKRNHIYFVESTNTTIIIKCTVDFRIYEWTCQKYYTLESDENEW